MWGYCNALLAPHFLWTEQAHYNHTFSGQGNPVFMSLSILLALHSPQAREPHVHAQPSGCVKQHSAIPAGSISWWRFPFYAHYGSFLFLLALAPGGVAGGMLQWPYSLARETGWSAHPLSKCKENINNAAYQFLWS